MRLTFGQLLYNLVNRGTAVARKIENPKEISAPTSIRLPSHVRAFYEAQAEALGGISFQAAITIALTGLAEASLAEDDFKNPSYAIKAICDRFFFLFDENGIDLVQIPSLLHDFGFTVSSLTTPERLEDLLRPRLLDFLASHMGIKEDWLKGSSLTVSDSKFNWYKDVPGAINRLSSYAKGGASVRVYFVRRKGANFPAALASTDQQEDMEPIGIVIRLDRKTADGVSYTTFEKWAFERWNYWRSRQQYKLLITFCDQASYHHYFGYAGAELEPHDFDLLRDGKCMPVTAMKNWRHGTTWHPEDYASLRKDPSPWVTEELKDFEDNVLPVYMERNYDRFLAPEYWM